ncbi:MAG: cell division protein FtsZ [Tepidimonas sp.]|uniref:cell division protein FtsZ n=1 Tax=Tepidimonas sp. TaxID=2002775 RepID=UPI004054BABD
MMSSLQLGLIVIGVVLLLVVWGYQRWQTRSLAPRRVETPAADSGGAQPALDRLDPTLDSDSVDTNDRPAPASASATGVLSERLDVLVPLRLDKPLPGDAVLQSLPGSRRIGSKPFFIEGLPDDAAAPDAWEPLRPGHRYRALRAGVQLANRAGPLNEIEYSEFVQKLGNWAEHILAAADFPDMMTVVQRARELDQFAAGHDAQLAFTIRARRAAWSPGYVMQHAARVGFVPGALPGRMVLPAAQPGGAPVLVLQFETQAALADDPELAVLREVRLVLEATHVPREERPYQRLRELCAALATAMDGLVTDDAGQVLDTDTLDRIEGEVEALYAALQAHGFPAGSPDARRLFS